jgi:predicted phage terminase large subunit-like protein
MLQNLQTSSSPVSPQLAAAELLRRRQARRNLLDFTKYTMPTFEESWHHGVMCEYLDAFTRLDITRLIISLPPRHTKSELVSRRLPALILGQDPDAPIIAASYGADLARRMNRDVQRIMDDAPYRRLFPNTKLSGVNVRAAIPGSWLRNSDMFEVVEYNGYYRGAGVGGAITGMGMKYGIIDDPIKNRQDANSPTIRDSIWSWYTSTFRTRLAPGGGILVTTTRWHEDDLVGRLLELAESDPKADQWVMLTLPAIAEESVADYDQRQPGDALWSARFDLAELSKTRVSLGTYDWNSLYQQRPSPPEGGMFKRQWFEIVGAAPRQAQRVRYWDKAGSSGKGDYTCGLLMAKDALGQFYVEDVVRGQWSSLERETIIKQTADLDAGRGHMTIWQEQEPGSGGLESAQATTRNLAGHVVLSERVTGDKATRAMPYAAQCEAKNVKLVKGEWNAAYLEELAGFPYGTHDDQVDASSGAFNKLTVASNVAVHQSRIANRGGSPNVRRSTRRVG